MACVLACVMCMGIMPTPNAMAAGQSVEQAKADADKKVDEAQKAYDDAVKNYEADKAVKADADKKVAEAQKAYDDAVKNHEADKAAAAQKLADAKTEQAQAKGEYATAEAAQEAGQKAVDSAKAALDKAKVESGATGVVDEEAISKGVGGFFESLMNDPSLTDDQRAQAKDAYNIIVKNSLNVPWYNEDVAGWGKDDAMSFQGLKNGLTYIDAMNAIRKENHLNTLGINLRAMAIAILNSEHGGHSEISLDENWAPIDDGTNDGTYDGTADVNEWERVYQTGDYDWDKDWPYVGWYTAEKHTYEEELKQHPDLAGMSAGDVYYIYPDVSREAGHYLNFIDPDLKSMGFGVGISGGNGANGGGAVWDGSTDDPTFSQEKFRGLVNNYINMVEGRGDVSKLVAPQKAYNDAVANQNKLKKAYDDAKQKVDEAQNKVNEAQRNIHKLQDVTALDNLKSELSSAKKQADEAQKNLDAANKQVTSTAEKLVEAKQKQAEAPTVTMFRLYNPNSGEHFYTGNAAERDHLAAVGWKSEGEGWTAPTSGDPVYRLYNPNAGDHHYTLNPAERDMLVKVGWTYEGVGWHSATASDTDRKPLYRQYNPNARAGAHNYTLSKAENDMLVRVGWRAEGLAWYAV